MLKFSFHRSLLLAASATVLAGALLPAAHAQTKTVLRVSTPAVPDDWHAKMWTVFKDSLEKKRAWRIRCADQPECFALQAGHRARRHGARQSGADFHFSV